jgi:HSP20 family protein
MITRFDPFREINALHNAMTRALQTAGPTGYGDELTTSGSFVPPVDIYEDENSISLRLEIPGMKQEDLDIRLENNTLTVRGERKFEQEEKEENFHRIERRYGSFARSFTLPNTVDSDKVNADYKDGVLSIELTKRAETKPKQIKIGVGAQKPESRVIDQGTKKGSGQAA